MPKVDDSFLARRANQVFLTVHLEPLNENQELNYKEIFRGNPEQIVQKSRQIIYCLQAVLTQGDFTIKINDFNETDCIIVTKDAVLDGEYEQINIFEEALK